MGLFDLFKKKPVPEPVAQPAPSASTNDFDLIVEQILEETLTKSKYLSNFKPTESNVFVSKIMGSDSEQNTLFIVDSIHKIHTYQKETTSSVESKYKLIYIREGLIAHLFRTKFSLSDDQISRIYTAMSSVSRYSYSHDILDWPINQLVNIIEKQAGDKQTTQSTLTLLKDLRSHVHSNTIYTKIKEKNKLIIKLDSLIFKSENPGAEVTPAYFSDDEFGDFANPYIKNASAEDQHIWFKLIGLCKKTSGAKPSKKTIEEGRMILKAGSADSLRDTINTWIVFLCNLKENEHRTRQTIGSREYIFVNFELISPANADTVKGFIWLCVNFQDKVTLSNIATLAERCYRNIPGQGPIAIALGNACLYVLSQASGLDGIGHLSRLKLRIKQNNTRKTIDTYLSNAAQNLGITVADIEDLATDDYGLINGQKEIVIDDYKAKIELTAVGKADVTWYKNDVAQKSVPSAFKENFSAELKNIKLLTKQIETSSSVLRDRIDRMFKTDRKLSWDKFNEFYFSHGLMSLIARRLIWSFNKNGNIVNAIWIENAWRDFNNNIIELNKENTLVSLWHPAYSTISEIQKWREYLIDQAFSQPVKQAFREVYFLTDAEINTVSYSNRMAAHILKQHQFSSLANVRGWRYTLLGAFDDGRFNEVASISIPGFALRAEFWVNEVNADNAFNDTGIWNYVSTDQVRFIDEHTNEPKPLIEIPKVVFSEIFRDVDLFVGVASVGNDPTWADNDGLPAYRDYWQSYSFGDLSEIAKTRKGILQRILPKLKIADITAIHDKFLVVKGKLRTYKIHIGSTNILMEPNDQYLCIVPERGKPKNESLFLPFEGDSGLSVIISKAFLLADDDKITDTSITSQINRK